MILSEDLKSHILSMQGSVNGSRFISVIESLSINPDDIQFNGRTLKIKPLDKMHEDPKELEEFFNDLDKKLAPLGLMSIVSEGAYIVIHTASEPSQTAEEMLSAEENEEEILACVDILASHYSGLKR